MTQPEQPRRKRRKRSRRKRFIRWLQRRFYPPAQVAPGYNRLSARERYQALGFGTALLALILCALLGVFLSAGGDPTAANKAVGLD